MPMGFGLRKILAMQRSLSRLNYERGAKDCTFMAGYFVGQEARCATPEIGLDKVTGYGRSFVSKGVRDGATNDDHGCIFPAFLEIANP